MAARFNVNLKPKNMKKKLFLSLAILIAVFSACFFAYAGNPNSFYGSEKTPPMDSKMKECIDACNNCASQCNNCASMCLKEKDVAAMTRCIQLCMECADICVSTSQLMSLGSDSHKDLCRICADLCKKCADECAKFNNDHCKKCAEACNKTADLCRKMASEK